MQSTSKEKSPALYPSLYEINTRVLTHELGWELGRRTTLDDISNDDLDRLQGRGFDWVWFMGVWQTGSAGQAILRENEGWMREYRELLPDFAAADVCGSPFAIARYEAHPEFGGNAALDRLRDRVHDRGMKLLLDFVPNHTALDHEWVTRHPEFYVHGSDEDLRSQPHNYIRAGSADAPFILAHGRDPYFDGWPDTAQLNYAEPALQEAMIGELRKIADHCDGLRCDMAMLLLPEIVERTWGHRPEPFWPRAIQAVRESHPDFLFIAEVYWDLEWELLQQGFDYTYDKRLYDRLRAGQAGPVRDHLRAGLDFQKKSVRFLENHDEPRAAAVFPLAQHQAAAIVAFLCPGMRFFHEGQFEGRKKRLTVHLRRRPDEPVDTALLEFYERLLACVNLPVVGHGAWSLLEPAAAWEGNWTADCFVCSTWEDATDRLVVVVNFAPNQSQCYLRLPFGEKDDCSVNLEDLMGDKTYQRDGADLCRRGLYLDLAGWGYHVFRLKASDLHRQKR